MLLCVQLIGGRAHDAGVEAVLRAVYGPEVCAPPFAAVCKIVGTIGVPCVGFDVVQAAEQLAAEIEKIFADFAGRLAEAGGVGWIEEGMAEGAAGRLSGYGVLDIGFAVMIEKTAELAALSAHDEAGVLQIELVAVELCCADFATHIGLQTEMLGKRGGSGHLVSGCALHGLCVALGDNGVQGVVGCSKVVFAVFGLVGSGSGVSELLEIEHAAELVEAADGGTALAVLPFGQAGVGQSFEWGCRHHK